MSDVFGTAEVRIQPEATGFAVRLETDVTTAARNAAAALQGVLNSAVQSVDASFQDLRLTVAALEKQLDKLRITPVSINITPDTTTMEAKVRASLESLKGLKVHIGVNTTELRADLRTALAATAGLTANIGFNKARTRAALQTTLETMAKVNANIGVDLSFLRADLAAKLALITNATINLRVDYSRLREDIRAKLATLLFSINVGIDINAVSLRAARAKIEAALSGIVANVNIGIDASTLAGVRAAIEAGLAGVGVDVNPRLDATLLAALQAQLAALSAQATGIGAGVGAAGASGAAAGGISGTTIAGLGALAAGATGIAAVVGLGGWGVKLAADAELAQLSFERFLGSGEAATAFIGELRAFAARTPFELPGLRTSAAQLLAVGIEAKDIIPVMETLGDSTSAMGTGSDGIRRATLALTQMKQATKVTAQDMRQFTEAGVPAWDALASVLGTNVAGAMKAVEDRTVDAQVMIDALVTRAGPQFQRVAGGMEDASHTLAGTWSTLKDTFSQGLGDLAAPLIGPLKDIVTTITTEVLPIFAEALAPALKSLVPVIGSVAKLMAPLLGTFLKIGTGVLDALGPMLATLVPAFAEFSDILGANLAPLGEALVPIFSSLSIAFVALLKPLMPIVGMLADLLAEVLPPIAALVSVLAMAFAATLMPVLERLRPVIADIAEWLGDHLTAAVVALVPILVTVGGFLQDLFAGEWGEGDPGTKLMGWLETLGTWLTDTAWPWIAEKAKVLGSALWAWIEDVTPVVLDKLGEWLDVAGAWATETALPWLMEKMSSFQAALIEWVQDAMPGALDKLTEFLGVIGSWIIDTALPWIGEQALALAPSLIDWIKEAAIDLPLQLFEFGFIIFRWFVEDLLPMIFLKVGELNVAILSWLWNAAKDAPGALFGLFGVITGWLINEAPGLIAGAVSGLWDGLVGAFSSALNVIIGMWNGLSIPSFTIGGWDAFGVTLPEFVTPQIDFPDIPMINVGTSGSGGYSRGGGVTAFHDGGIVGPDGTKMPFSGVDSDEVLALLQTGERVIPRGGSTNTGTTINISVSPVYGPGMTPGQAADLGAVEGQAIADKLAVLAEIRAS